MLVLSQPDLVFALVRSLPGIRGVVQSSKQKILSELQHDLSTGEKKQYIVKLPTKGKPDKEVLQVAKERKKLDCKELFNASKLTGTIYASDQIHRELCSTVYCDFAHTNPLHSSEFPSVAQMEYEIVTMTASLLSGHAATSICGTVTSGGTESILTAVRASRDFVCYIKGISEPEMYAVVQFYFSPTPN